MNLDSTISLAVHINSLKDKLNKAKITPLSYDFSVIKIQEKNWKSVPIIINSFNRKKYLEEQVSYLKSRGYNNIYIIDNKSSYLPLLEFYKSENLRVFYLSENVGYLSLWETGVFDLFLDSYYVYTDSDVVPSEAVPDDFIEKFAGILNDYIFLDKVGFSLELDDLSNKLSATADIKKHEMNFWMYDIDLRFYFAPIDTTFALYRPNVKGGWWLKSGRTFRPYIAKHLPWYEDKKRLSEEDIFYYENIKKKTNE